MGFALWSSHSQCRCTRLLRRTDLDSDQRVIFWNSSGAPGMAEQSVAGDEERAGGFNAAAAVCLTGPVAGRTNCNLHAARNGVPYRRARHGANAARSPGLPTARRDVG